MENGELRIENGERGVMSKSAVGSRWLPEDCVVSHSYFEKFR
jgi:hypothetical protein